MEQNNKEKILEAGKNLTKHVEKVEEVKQVDPTGGYNSNAAPTDYTPPLRTRSKAPGKRKGRSR